MNSCLWSVCTCHAPCFSYLIEFSRPSCKLGMMSHSLCWSLPQPYRGPWLWINATWPLGCSPRFPVAWFLTGTLVHLAKLWVPAWSLWRPVLSPVLTLENSSFPLKPDLTSSRHCLTPFKYIPWDMNSHFRTLQSEHILHVVCIVSIIGMYINKFIT